MNYTLHHLTHTAKLMARSVFGKRKEYQLQFNHEADGLWYLDFPSWPFSHHNLLMVSGADRLCAFLSDNDKFTRVSVIPSSKRASHEGYFELQQLNKGLTSGSTYIDYHYYSKKRRKVNRAPVFFAQTLLFFRGLCYTARVLRC